MRKEKNDCCYTDALDGNTSVQPDDDFQVVKSKKASIKKKPPLASCYKTRGKAGSPKPFK
jgi:hypothetical protein